MILYDVKPESHGGPGSLVGVHPLLAWGPLAWMISAVTLFIMGRRPYVTGARADRLRSDGTDDPGTLHDDGRALDLRANDRPLETRQRYADALRKAFAPFGDAIRVRGPYDLPEGHVHVELLDPGAVAEAFGLAGAAALALILLVRG